MNLVAWLSGMCVLVLFFFFQAEDGIRDWSVTGVQTCALPISACACSFSTRLTRCSTWVLPRISTRFSKPLPRRSKRRSLRRRSEERRVGKECRSRWTTYHYKKKRSKTKNIASESDRKNTKTEV